jgi:hypothetical protein
MPFGLELKFLAYEIIAKDAAVCTFDGTEN